MICGCESERDVHGTRKNTYRKSKPENESIPAYTLFQTTELDTDIQGYNIKCKQESGHFDTKHERTIVRNHLEQTDEDRRVNNSAEQHDKIRNKGLVQWGVGFVLLADVRIETVVNKLTITVFRQKAVTSVHG